MSDELADGAGFQVGPTAVATARPGLPHAQLPCQQGEGIDGVTGECRSADRPGCQGTPRCWCGVCC